jgi:hypothetical protein
MLELVNRTWIVSFALKGGRNLLSEVMDIYKLFWQKEKFEI